MLTQMLSKNKTFLGFNLEKQDVLIRLANHFQSDFMNLYLSPTELHEESQLGTQNQWEELLTLDTTQQYIKQQMSQQLNIAQRKAILALQAQAQLGNVAAAKEIQNLSGILNDQDNNKVIILHQIQRPKPIKEGEREDNGTNI